MRIEDQIALVKSQTATVRKECDYQIRYGRMTPQARDEQLRRWNDVIASLKRLKRIDEAEERRQLELL